MLRLVVETSEAYPRENLFVRFFEWIVRIPYLSDRKNGFSRRLTNIETGDHIVARRRFLKTEFPVQQRIELLVGDKHTAFQIPYEGIREFERLRILPPTFLLTQNIGLVVEVELLMVYLELVSACRNDLLIGILEMIPKPFVRLNFIPEVILGNTRSTYFYEGATGGREHRFDTLSDQKVIRILSLLNDYKIIRFRFYLGLFAGDLTGKERPVTEVKSYLTFKRNQQIGIG